MKPILYIIEDDQTLSSIYQEAFEKIGFSTIAIRNGQDAISTFSQKLKKRPKAILLDLHLPDVSGREILNFLRNDTSYDLVKIVVISADSLQLRLPEIQKKSNYTVLKPLRYAKLLELGTSILQAD